jgi:hypothetical protein
MAHLLGVWIRARLRRCDGLSGLDNERAHGAVLGLQPAALGIAQTLVGKLESGEVPECLAHSLEPLLEAHAQRAERTERPLTGTDDRKGSRRSVSRSLVDELARQALTSASASRPLRAWRPVACTSAA